MRSLLLDLKGCWKLKFLKRKGSLSSEKNILACFARSIEHDENQRKNYKRSKVLLTFIVQVLMLISKGNMTSIEANISKKVYLPGDKRF